MVRVWGSRDLRDKRRPCQAEGRLPLAVGRVGAKGPVVEQCGLRADGGLCREWGGLRPKRKTRSQPRGAMHSRAVGSKGSRGGWFIGRLVSVVKRSYRLLCGAQVIGDQGCLYKKGSEAIRLPRLDYWRPRQGERWVVPSYVRSRILRIADGLKVQS